MIKYLLVIAFSMLAGALLSNYINRTKYENLRNHYVSMIMSLAAAIDSKDAYSLGHTERVSDLSMQIAEEMRKKGKRAVNRRFKDSLQLAALLHDIGKIGVPEKILRKPGPLTKDEWGEIKKHPDFGANIMGPLEDQKELKQAILHHQEHFDGSGYPEKLKAKDIPLMSRIIMLVDAYDAITSDRPYRKKRSIQEAAEEIRKNSGKQFDPEVVEAFLSLVRRHKLK